MNEHVELPGAVGVEVAAALLQFINEEAIPGTGVEPGRFWTELVVLLRQLAPRNAELLARRAGLQARLDAWHQRLPGAAGYGTAYEAMLAQIG